MSSATDKTSDTTCKRPDKSKLLSRLLTIPFVNIAVSVVGTVLGIARRKSPFLDSVANRGERVFYAVVQSSREGEDTLTKSANESELPTLNFLTRHMNTVLSTCVMSSKKVLHQGTHRILLTARNSAHFILHTIPGRIFMWTFDRVNGAMVTVLYFIRPDLKPSSNQHHPLNNGSTKGHLNHLSENLKKDGTLIQVMTLIVQPYVILASGVQMIHCCLHQIADGEQAAPKVCLSPDKQAEILSRRKVSPKKKLKAGFLNTLQNTAGYFGLSKIVPGLKRKFNIDFTGYGTSRVMSPNKLDDDEKKRKYEDIVSESGTETDEEGENLRTLDLENYISDEDPDYLPACDGESTDSDEYKEGETESDIDIDNAVDTSTIPVKKIEEQTIRVEKNEKKPESTQFVRTKKVVDAKTSQEQNESAKHSDSTQSTDQVKPTPVKSAQLSVDSPPKPGTKTSPALKCSTPKDSTRKENSTHSDSKVLASVGSKKLSSDTKPGTFESTDKKTDSKSYQLANGDKKGKGANSGGKKGTNGDKK